MVAYPLIFGELTSESYTDASASDPRIDALRAKIFCVEEKAFSVDYHDPAKRSIGNALLVELNDGTVLDEVVVEYPVGHKRRREEGTPLLMEKFTRHISHHFEKAHQQKWVFFIWRGWIGLTRPQNFGHRHRCGIVLQAPSRQVHRPFRQGLDNTSQCIVIGCP